MAEARPGFAPGKEITKAVSLLEPLGAGGMGAVWLANHEGLKTRVVVKFMLVGMDASETARMRFSREAAAAAQVKSPHVVQMLDHGVTDDGVPFIVMEHLEGHDLGDEIEEKGALDPALVVMVVIQVAKALSKVHAAGLLHRDIKPDNIFLVDGEDDVFVKLLDFGIAKAATVDPAEGSLDGETKTGQIVGTPFYMSPEQVTAQKVIDHRSDLWALGVVAYEALTGQRPFDGPSFGALAVKIATGTADKPSKHNGTLPPAVDDWFAKACARDARDRFASAKELADAFRAAFDGVLSLPMVSSDSGSRSGPSAARSASRPDSGERSGGGTLGLAATALADSGSGSASRPVALGASIASGASLAETGTRRGSALLFIGVAALLTVAVIVVVVLSVKGGSAATRLEADAAPSHAVGVSSPASASVPASVASAPPTVDVDAAAPAASSSPPAAASVPTKPSGRAPAPLPVAKPSPEPASKPPSTAKPSTTEPDLY